MHILVPITVTAAMLAADPVAEPDGSVGELAWSASGSYVVGDRRVSDAVHGIYECVQAVGPTATRPEDDPSHWLYWRPSNKYAAFDSYISTASVAAGDLTRVVRPGFINAVAIYGLIGSAIQITYRDQPAGTVYRSVVQDLIDDVADEYEYCFGAIETKDRILVTDLPPWPDAELTITVAALDGQAAIGLIALGDLRPLSITGVGGTEFGPSVEPQDYSYIKTESDGTTTIVRRNAATNMRASVLLDAADTRAALRALQGVLSVPCAWIADTAEAFEGLNVFGLGSSSLTYASARHRKLSVTVKGLI